MDKQIETIDVHKKIVCVQKSQLGFKLDIGTSGFKYNDKTANWLSNHWGGLFGFYIIYNKFSFGFKFKPWTVSPLKDIVFNSDTLKTNAKLNPIKLDFTVGYSIDFKNYFSLEPYIGLNRSIFVVINEKDIEKSYDLKTSYGLTIGLAIYKYLSFKNYQHVSIFSTFGYNSTDFKRTNQQLGVGFLDWSFGIGLKFHSKTKLIKPY